MYLMRNAPREICLTLPQHMCSDEPRQQNRTEPPCCKSGRSLAAGWHEDFSSSRRLLTSLPHRRLLTSLPHAPKTYFTPPTTGLSRSHEREQPRHSVRAATPYSFKTPLLRAEVLTAERKAKQTALKHGEAHHNA